MGPGTYRETIFCGETLEGADAEGSAGSHRSAWVCELPVAPVSEFTPSHVRASVVAGGTGVPMVQQLA